MNMACTGSSFRAELVAWFSGLCLYPRGYDYCVYWCLLAVARQAITACVGRYELRLTSCATRDACIIRMCAVTVQTDPHSPLVQASCAAMVVTSALFWDVTQRRVVKLYRRFGEIYWSRLFDP
jgi:hypothetical protein